MSIGYWDVVSLDEDRTRFACQRTPIFGDNEFETVGPFDTEDEAHDFCEGLNEQVPDELDALPDHLK